MATRKTEDEMSESRVSGQKLLALLNIRFGGSTKTVLEALDEAVAICAKTSRQANGKTAITLSIGLKPDGEGELIAEATIKLKVPEPRAIPEKLYTDRSGLLYDEDPNQRKIDFPTPIEARKE